LRECAAVRVAERYAVSARLERRAHHPERIAPVVLPAVEEVLRVEYHLEPLLLEPGDARTYQFHVLLRRDAENRRGVQAPRLSENTHRVRARLRKRAQSLILLRLVPGAAGGTERDELCVLRALDLAEILRVLRV